MNMVDSQRGGASDLAAHLLKDENEHIDVHELRGFASETLHEAFNEVYAVSRGTGCSKFLYSLSLNPPPEEKVKTETFLDAIDRVEQKQGLVGQPRAIVFHEKNGRRHAHAVWSRIDVVEMKAIQLSFTKKKNRDISRQLFIEHGWKMPKGYTNSKLKDPKSFTLAEWQQAKRAGKDPRAIKTALQDAWAISDSKAAFIHAMEERGYKVARGDRRSFVAVDVQGEVWSIPRQANVKTRLVRERLGCPSLLPSVAEAKDQIAEEMLPKLDKFQDDLETQNRNRRMQFERLRQSFVERQRRERNTLQDKIEARRIAEAKQRQSRFRKGLGGFWDRLRGEHRRIRQLNQCETAAARKRDAALKDALVFKHLEQRRQITRAERHDYTKRLTLQRGLSKDRRQFEAMKTPPKKQEQIKRARSQRCRDAQPAPTIRGPSRER